jgi:hypothetical protein
VTTADPAGLLHDAVLAQQERFRAVGNTGAATGLSSVYPIIDRLIPPNAILIDPTAPETVAALANGALDAGVDLVRLDENDIRRWHTDGTEAAAILPAFVARLRGKP